MGLEIPERAVGGQRRVDGELVEWSERSPAIYLAGVTPRPREPSPFPGWGKWGKIGGFNGLWDRRIIKKWYGSIKVAQ